MEEKQLERRFGGTNHGFSADRVSENECVDSMNDASIMSPTCGTLVSVYLI